MTTELRKDFASTLAEAMKVYRSTVASSEPLDPAFAKLSYTLDVLNGTVKRAVDYARMWRWTKPRVGRFLDALRVTELWENDEKSQGSVTLTNTKNNTLSRTTVGTGSGENEREIFQEPKKPLPLPRSTEGPDWDTVEAYAQQYIKADEAEWLFNWLFEQFHERRWTDANGRAIGNWQAWFRQCYAQQCEEWLTLDREQAQEAQRWEIMQGIHPMQQQSRKAA